MSNLNIKKAVKEVVDLLVAREYDRVVQITGGFHLSSEDMARAVKDYGRTLQTLPADAYDRLDVIQVRNVSVPTWSVRVDLWSEEEGRSDLSAEMTVIQDGDSMRVELDDIHVF